jgi:hypothetical protein
MAAKNVLRRAMLYGKATPFLSVLFPLYEAFMPSCPLKKTLTHVLFIVSYSLTLLARKKWYRS